MDQRSVSVCLLQPFLFLLFVFVEIRMQRVAGGEEEIAKAHRNRRAPQRLAAAVGERLEVEGVVPQAAGQRLAPRAVLADGVRRILGQALDGVSRNLAGRSGWKNWLLRSAARKSSSPT